MSDVRISQLPDGSIPLSGTEEVPVVQDVLGIPTTVKTTAKDIANLSVQSVTEGIGVTVNNTDPLNPIVELGYIAEDVGNKSTTDTLFQNSDTLYPSQKAVKTYVDATTAGLLDDRGGFEPDLTSPGVYPTSGGSGTFGAIVTGDIWFFTRNGFVGTTAVVLGGSIRALTDAPSPTWNILNATIASQQNLQQVLSQGRDLTSNNNFQGLNSGDSLVAGTDINGFGEEAAKLNSGNKINAFGNQAAYGNGADNVNAFGSNAGQYNDIVAVNLNAFGEDAGKSNSGSNVNAFGYQAGVSNTFNNVQLLGNRTTADGDNQLALRNTAGRDIRFTYDGITADRKYTLPNATGIIALTSDISQTTLQQATSGANKDLTNSINLQGTDAGAGQTGSNVNLFGGNAGFSNTKNNVNAFGSTAAGGNTGENVNAFGFNAAGNYNSYSNVNAFGRNAYPDDSNQTVFSKDGGTALAKLSYNILTANRKYELPDKSGTLALLSDITNSSGWALTGNTGTTAGTNFIGTTDAQDLVFKANSAEVFRAASGGFITSLGSIGVTYTTGNPRRIRVSSPTNLSQVSAIGIDSNIGYLKLGNGTGDATIKSTNLSTTGLALELPNAGGTLALTNTTWGLTGNGGTTAGTNFIGTTDANDLVFKVNNTERLRIDSVYGEVKTTGQFRAEGSGDTLIMAASTIGNGTAALAQDSINKGYIFLGNGVTNVQIQCNNITSARVLQVPDASGIIAVSTTVGYSGAKTIGGQVYTWENGILITVV